MDVKKNKQFMETMEDIYRKAEELEQLQGTRAVVDYLIGWADDCLHGEIFKGLADEVTTAHVTIYGRP